MIHLRSKGCSTGGRLAGALRIPEDIFFDNSAHPGDYAMKPEAVRNVLIMIYMVGNAAFNSVFKIERAAMAMHDSWASIMLKALGLALVWPLYWLWRVVT
jgi:hypothetical protein